MQAVRYHWYKYGKVAALEDYTADASSFFRHNNHLGQPVTLKDGTVGIKIRLDKGQLGGIYTRTGKSVTFWYK